jgi:hypothetical protein
VLLAAGGIVPVELDALLHCPETFCFGQTDGLMVLRHTAAMLIAPAAAAAAAAAAN